MTELDYMFEESIKDLDIGDDYLELGEEIGSGAFGRVIKATVRGESKLPPGLRNNMTVAVKFLRGE